MCGIVGYIGDRNATEVVLEGLRRWEYRGYDSAGVAVVNGKGLEVRRCRGAMMSYLSLIPAATDSLAPLITVLPLQLLAYHIAVLKGCDVGQPRNLAKSVTVE